MQYVIDTSILVEISERYYPEVFPSLWDKIYDLIDSETIVSLIEVQKELDKVSLVKIGVWLMLIQEKNFLKILKEMKY